MNMLHHEVERKREQILRICERHGAANVRVFGSVVRGEAGMDSDLDLLVELGGPRTLWWPGGIVAELEDLLGRRVDIVTEAALHPLIRDAVLREARPL
jgi:uncharacterized protein